MSTLLYVPQLLMRLFVHEVADSTIVNEALALEIRRVAQSLTSTFTPLTISVFNGRLERGLELALNGSVRLDPTPTQPHRCRVISSDRSHTYLVDIDTKYCECPDSQKGNYCKHRIAAFYFTQAVSLQSPNHAPVKLNKTASPAQPPKPPTNPTLQPPVKPQAPTAPSREEQILKELGFDAEPKKLVEAVAPQPSVRLGNLYRRRYLHGEDLDQKPVKVTITDLTKETVTPHPSQLSYQKWCLWVSGLPQGMPCGILFGPQGDKDLVAIFGRVDIASLKGKALIIYPQPMNVAGQSRIAIRFRRAQ